MTESLPEGAEQVNDCAYCYATDIREVEELALRMVIEEAKAQTHLSVDARKPLLENLLSKSSPIETDASCRHFVVQFAGSSMVSYSVLNESYGRYPEPPEEFHGKLFRRFTKSHLLDYTERTTNASFITGRPLLHFQLACLNHVIDVISTEPPSISHKALTKSR